MPLQQTEPITAADVERTLRSVLARPEYAPPERSLVRRALDAVATWFNDNVWPAIKELLRIPDAADPGWQIVGQVVLAVGALVGVAVIVYWTIRAVRWWRRRRRDRESGSEEGRAAPLTAVDWEALATAAAEAGEWREAAHALYQATLLRLGEAGVVRVDGSKTPGDYRREVRSRDSAVATRMEAFLRWFERIAYGRDEPGPDQFARLSDSARTLAAHG